MIQEKQNELTPTYGVMTSIAMIVGIVVGSGIYFKADDILNFTGGNLFLGVIIILLGAFNILFGSLSLAQLAKSYVGSGGIMSFFAEYYDDKAAYVVGMFQMFIYLPIITAIVSWVAVNYIEVLLEINFTFEMEIICSGFLIIMIAGLNLFSKQMAGYFQNLSTMVKLIPLILIIVFGIFSIFQIGTSSTNDSHYLERNVGFSWLAGLVPLAFTYDGWTVVSNIAPEIKNPKRNLPLAYILGSLAIVLLYVLYFIGLVNILGENKIMSLGNEAIYYAVNQLFGNGFAKLMVGIVIISVLGVVNGVFLANARIPQSYAQREWIRSEKLKKVDQRYGISIMSVLVTLGISLLWLIVHYVLVTTALLPNTDISESAVVFNQLCLLPLYVIVIKHYRQKKIKNIILGLFSPLLAILGVLILIVGNAKLNFAGAIFTSIFGIVALLIFYHFARKSLGNKSL